MWKSGDNDWKVLREDGEGEGEGGEAGLWVGMMRRRAYISSGILY